MVTIEVFGLQLLNALSLGVLYILLAAGLSLIFGVSEIVNFAHGSLYMLGAFVGLSVVNLTGSFWAALLLAPLIVGLVGVIIEVVLLRPIYDRDHLYQIVLTFGVSLMILSLVKWWYGNQPQYFSTPPGLTGVLTVGPLTYSKYKLFVVGAGLLITLFVWLLLEKTDMGLILRAGSQRQTTVQILGIEITRYFTLVFGIGSALAGLAGVLAGPYLNVSPQMGNEIIIVVFIVVILGGLGSFRGSVVAALLIGLIEVFEAEFVPFASGFLIYVAMIAVLVLRPEGLFGEYNVRKQVSKASFSRIIPPVRPTNRKFLAFVVLLALVPFGAGVLYSSYFVSLVAIIFAWAILALSFDLVTGYLGLLSLGHAAFFGISAYSVALSVTHFSESLLVGAAIAIVASAAFAWVVGALSVRLTGVYFAMITLASAQLVYQLAFVWTDFTGGENGLNVDAISLLGLELGGLDAYYIGLAAVVGVYAAAVLLLDSRFGHAVQAVRESERRMTFLGYDTNKVKRRTFTISGVFAGIGGVVFLLQQMFVSPSSVHWLVSGNGLMGMMIGGLGTLFGPLLGAGVFVGFEQVVSSYTEQWQFFLGLILVLVVLFAPRGLVGLYGDITEAVFGPTSPFGTASGNQQSTTNTDDTAEGDR